jgi:hypothetical protein
MRLLQNIVVLIAAVCAVVPSSVAQPNGGHDDKDTERLRGRIVVDGKPPNEPVRVTWDDWERNVLPKIEEGTFDGMVLPQQREVWYVVPDWAVGRWTAIASSSKSVGEGLRHVERTFGCEKDVNGRIWMFSRGIAIERPDGDDLRVLNIMEPDRPMETKNGQFALKHRDMSIVYSRSKHKVMKMLVTEFLDEFSPVDAEHIQQRETMIHRKDIGFEVDPDAAKHEVTLRKTQPFTYRRDKELYESFKNYLVSIGVPQYIQP